jgi:spore germination protein YaaH
LQGEAAHVDFQANIIPVVSNLLQPNVVDLDSITALLANPNARAAHAQHLADRAVREGYTAIALDYREIPPDLRPQFSDLVQGAAAALHAENRVLVVIIPAAQQHEAGWSGGAYDWRTIGQFADEVIVRAPPDPSVFAPGGSLEGMLHWGVGEINRYQLFLAVPVTGVVHDQTAGTFSPIGLAVDATRLKAALDAVLSAAYQARINQDPNSGMQSLDILKDDQVIRTIWLMDAEALAHRMRYAQQFHLGGVMLIDGIAPDVNPLLADWFEQQ